MYRGRCRTSGLIISLLLLLRLAATVVAPGAEAATADGFGVLDPNDATLDAGTLAKLTPAAAAGAPGVVAAGAHVGTPPGVISALPPIGGIAYPYWGLIAVGAALFVTAVVLLARRRRSPARSGQGGAPQTVPTFSGRQYPGQPYPGQQYPGQPYPGQPYPGAPQYPSQDRPQPYQPLPFREPAYPTRPNWSPLPPPSSVPPSSVPPSSVPPSSVPPSPGPAPWEQAPPSPAHAPWEQPPPSPAAAPWEPAPPPPDPPESGKGWFDPR